LSDEGTSGSTCIFCDRPSGSVEYAWPEWLCRFLTENPRTWGVGGKDPAADLLRLERMRHEIDQTVMCVCDVCSRGWIQRLEDRVSPFLQSMIVGDATPLSPVRRRLLARWAAKTAVVMECASDAPYRTPRFACEFLRRIGVHPGTQVLLGKYDGDRRFLAHERDVFSRMIDGEKCYIPQASFIIGAVFIQVFSDPWRDTAPEPAEPAVQPFIPLVGRDIRTVVWPPAVSIDDAGYDLARNGPNDEHHSRPGPRDLDEARRTLPASDDLGEANQTQSARRDAGIRKRRSNWRLTRNRPARAPDPTTNGSIRASTGGAPNTHDTQVRDDTTTEVRAQTSRPRVASRVAYAVVMLIVASGLVGYALHERSNAARWRASSLGWQARAQTRNSPELAATPQPSAPQPKVGSVNNASTTTTLGASSSPLTARPERLNQIINTVPSVTRGLEQCASAALATASDALTFAAAFPNATTNAVDADSTTVSSVCGTARAAANRLNELVDTRTQ